VHCDLDVTLAVLRGTLQNGEDDIMLADDRFHQGDFRVGGSTEPNTKSRVVLQVGLTLNMVIP